tara:strand:- start:6919 stop:7269 length:351 start_codon:yes stop_codon:yes gene_type:complete
VLRVIIYQSLITIVVAIVFLDFGSDKIWSSLFGGIIAIVNTLLLASSINRAGIAASEQQTAKGALTLVKGVMTRLALVLLGFYIGIVYLELIALEILVAFALAQTGYVFYKTKNIY